MLESSRLRSVTSLEWWIFGDAALECPDGIVSVDVWEHANVIFECGTGGKPGRVRGHARVAFTGSDEEIGALVAVVSGTATCDADGATLEFTISGRGRGGFRVELQQTGLIDTSTGEIEWADEVRATSGFVWLSETL
jgi:hypothetical protein